MVDWMDYWGLKGDPFSNADEPVNYNDPYLNSIIVETKVVKELERIFFTDAAIEQKKLFVIGERGSGKSQCLNYIISKNLDNINERKILPIYIPFTKLSVFNRLSPPRYRKLTISILFSSINLIKSSLVKSCAGFAKYRTILLGFIAICASFITYSTPFFVVLLYNSHESFIIFLNNFSHRPHNRIYQRIFHYSICESPPENRHHIQSV